MITEPRTSDHPFQKHTLSARSIPYISSPLVLDDARQRLGMEHNIIHHLAPKLLTSQIVSEDRTCSPLPPPLKHQPLLKAIRWGFILILGSMPQIVQAKAPNFSAEQLEFFEKKVRPLLSAHCYECHSVNSEKLQAGLLVDSRAALILSLIHI